MKKKSLLKYIIYPFLSNRAKIMAKLIQSHIHPGSTILDIGCGNMLIAKKLQENIKIRAHGIDVIDMNLTELPFKMFNGKELPYPDNSFDVCLFIGVLHHVENQDKLLKEARRVARKKIIIFEDIFFSKIGKLWIKVRDVVGNIPEELNMNFAFKFNNLSRWKNIFKKLHLKILYSKIFFNHFRMTHHVIFVLAKKY